MTKIHTREIYREEGNVSLLDLLKYNERINSLLTKKIGLNLAHPEREERLSAEFLGEKLRVNRETIYEPRERIATNSYIIQGRIKKDFLKEIEILGIAYGFRKAE